ncbi:MAG: TerB family tellurite resistance protein [Sandaracinaceae bacterium]|nr:TerB family tellurite resistance protein [Sandaracinaceae bacterium]
MELSELTHDEVLVLVGFMRVVIQADGQFSNAEREHVALVRTALGTDRFTQAMLEATERFADNESLKRATKAISRPAARRAIHDVLVKIAASDTLTAEEDKPLRWIESWWELPRT